MVKEGVRWSAGTQTKAFKCYYNQKVLAVRLLIDVTFGAWQLVILDPVSAALTSEVKVIR